MKALSILQPWAWLIVNGHKDIENRGWHTAVRGRILVHAGKTYSRKAWEEDAEYFYEAENIIIPAYDRLARGCIVGEVEILDCVRHHPSRWKNDDSWGFVLANAKALTTPTPYRGQLGFFEISHVDGVVDLFTEAK